MKILAHLIFSSILGSTLASAALADDQQQLFEVTYSVQDSSGNPFGPIDAHLFIQNIQSGEVQEESHDGFLVPAGEYRITGKGYFCGVSEEIVQVTADINVKLIGWCE